MPEIILITLAKNRFHVFKNEVRNKKNRKGGAHPPYILLPLNSKHATQKRKRLEMEKYLR